MSAVKITEGIYSVGIMNPNMRVFDIVIERPTRVPPTTPIWSEAAKRPL